MFSLPFGGGVGNFDATVRAYWFFAIKTYQLVCHVQKDSKAK